MRSPRSILLLFLILTAAVAGVLYYPRRFAEFEMESRLAGILAEAPADAAIPARTQSQNCALRGNSPDPACSPGAIFPNATLAQICVPGYTKTVRDVPQKLREAVFSEYGISYPQPFGSYEVDHIIPLALGGSNDIANLFPQPAEPQPGFHEKDIVEIYLYEAACAGTVSLSAAQEQIAKDWLSIYRNIPPDEISAIKSKFATWTN